MNTSCQNRPKSGGSPQSAEALRNEIAETEIANRMLADFSAMISHDAQSAVRRIVSSAELLRLLPSVANDSHALAFLHTIVGSTGKIQLLIGDALTMPASHLVERRTAGQETRTPLTRQLAEARALNRQLCELAGSVAGRLNDPLMQVISISCLLMTLPAVTANPVGADMAGQIVAGAARLQRLVEDYLAFSRSRPKELKRQRVSLENAVELARHELEAATAGRVVTWVIHALPSVEGDASMLRQAFLNLLSNSLKFSRTRSETRIEVGVESDTPELVLFVRDNGIGFEPALAAELFNKFHRGQSTENCEGTGVGLTIVQHIIQRHGGRVWAEALPDKGATFYIAFPARCV